MFYFFKIFSVYGIYLQLHIQFFIFGVFSLIIATQAFSLKLYKYFHLSLYQVVPSFTKSSTFRLFSQLQTIQH